MERVAKLGSVGDVVTVKNGYARNFLIPNNLALFASEQNLKSIESLLKQQELKNAKENGTKLDAQKLINDFMTEGQRWDKRGMAGIRSIAQDLIWFGLGEFLV